ncbi:BQ5605_C014g07548 [Microbotryum silenes-dioicae]|uniref:BQ5605_C014g07548 protein n=1 Tax=Microbotryum silenes-dioicae TaxID=796604 RepID=A0A2X0LU81_9BASI|nr:BQ5605_C014g07548 [Microbotryum silenes-dioicae]
MSIALIQGSSGSLGTHFVQHLLRTTSLQVIATSRNPSSTRSHILSSAGLQANKVEDRLTVLEMDVTKEDTIEKAAKDVEGKFGKGSLRLLLNVSGVLHADKSITQVKQDELLHHYQVRHSSVLTRAFPLRIPAQINTFGHLLTYKHFMPLLPKKSDVKKALESNEEDPAKGAVPKGLSVLASLTARVGSIGDNAKGGWVGYRSSKAAANQVVMTLHRELQLRATPSIAISLHPGTVVGTNLSKEFTNEEDAGKKDGVFTAEDSTRRLLDVIKGLKEGDGGRFLDWKGEDIVW